MRQLHLRPCQLLLILTGILLSSDETTIAQPVGDFSGSLTHQRNRAAEQSLQLARNALDEGDFSEAVRLIQIVLDAPTDSLVLENDAYRSAWDVADDLISGMSTSGRTTYERLSGPAAAEDLARGLQTGSAADLRRVVLRFRLTEAGQRACLTLARLALDRGEPRVAAIWSRRLDSAMVDSHDRTNMTQRLIEASLSPHDDHDRTSGVLEIESGSQPSWNVLLSSKMAELQALKMPLAELDAQGIVPLLTSMPVFDDGRILIRRLGQLLSVDGSTGEVLWSQNVDAQSAFGAPSETPQNFSLHSRAMFHFVERLLNSSILDQLSTDGDRVFTIADASHRDSDTGEYVIGNTLIALSVEDGTLIWTAGTNGVATPSIAGSNKQPQQDPSLFDVYFLTTPQPVWGLGLALGQQGSTVSLIAIDLATGHLEWSVPLGQAVRSLKEDLSRHGAAGLITVNQGRAYCVTAAGSFACVDLLTRRMVWSVRTPRDNIIEPVDEEQRNLNNREVVAQLRMPTRAAWHAPFLHVDMQRVVMASPDSDHLSAFDVATGALLWSRPRETGLMIAGGVEERLLIIGKDVARALSIVDGHEMWKSPIERPAGEGVLTGNQYVFPTLAGGMQSVRLCDGRVTRFDQTNVAPNKGLGMEFSYGPPSRLRSVQPRNLLATDAGVFALSLDEIEVVSLSSADADSAPPTPKRSVNAVTPGIEAENGWRNHRMIALAMSVRPTMLSLVPALSGVDATIRLAIRLIPMMKPPHERSATLVREFATAVQSNNDSAAISIIKQFERLPLKDIYLTDIRSSRTVRLDRWLLHGLTQAISATPAQQDELQRLLPEQFPGHPLRATSEQDRAASLAASNQYGMAVWGTETPVVVEEEILENALTDSLYVRTVPLTVTGDSPWEWVTVQVDRSGKSVYFSRADEEQPIVVALPPAKQSPRMMTELHHAWANGPLLVLRIGSELFGFHIEDASGALPRSFSWPSPGEESIIVREGLTRTAELKESGRTPAVLWDDSQTGLYDVFGRPYLQVGPVNEACVCYMDRDRLIALDPQTGREIWSRFGLPVGTHCVGDDQELILLGSDTSSIEVLRSIDGETTHVWDWQESAYAALDQNEILTSTIAVHGTLALCHSLPNRIEGRRLRLQELEREHMSITLSVVDLSTGKQFWTREIAPDVWPVRLDGHTIALIDPRGQIAVIEWQSGADISVHETDMPEEISAVDVIVQADQWFVLVSRLSDDRDVVGTQQVLGADRRPIINGWVHALSREDFGYQWSIRLENMGIPLDQPRHVPFFISNYSTMSPDENGRLGLLRCYDRRDGQLLHEHQQANHIYHTFRCNLDAQKIDLQMRNQQVIFVYTSSP